MTKTKHITLPALHRLQQEIDDDEHRFQVVSCGRRWGKTFLSLRRLFKIMERRFVATRKRQRGWIVAPTFPLVREDWITAETILKDAITKKRETAMRMDIDPFGFIEFKSAERDDEGLRGAGLDACVVDEASRVSRKAWEQGLRPALADKLGKCIFISTPKGRNWFYEMWLRGQVDNPEIKSWKHPTYTNPYFPGSEWKTIQETTPDMILKQEYLADFLEDEASVFKNISKCLRGQLEPYQEGERYTFGVDLGKSEDFTVITGIKESTCQVVYIQRFNKIDWSLQKKQITTVSQLYQKPRFYIDSTGLGSPIEEDLRYAGVNTQEFKFSSQSKQELVEQLIVAIEQGMIGIPEDPKTHFLINELKAFTYEILPSGRLRYSAPEGLHDDGVISLGLAVRGISHALYRRKMEDKPEVTYNSAKYLEIKRYEQETKHNSRLSRRRKQYIPEPAFGF